MNRRVQLSAGKKKWLWLPFVFPVTTLAFELIIRTPTMTTIPATSSDVQRFGRFHTTASNTVVEAWSGSDLALRFTGDSVAVVLYDRAIPAGGEQNYFAVQLDGAPFLTLATHTSPQRYVLASELAPGPHTIRLFKRTEAVEVGQAEIVAFEITNGQVLPPDPRPARRIEIVGDSIGCGYGNEASGAFDNFKPSTENNYLTYGQIAARHFGAECNVVAWSGQGVFRDAQGNPGHPIPTVYDQVLPPATNILWDFSAWVPQVIVINLGTNDFNTGIPDHDTFVNTYVDFVKRVAQLNGNPFIICCLGPMLKDDVPAPGDLRLTTARSYIQEVVQTVTNDGVPNVSFLEFTPLSGPLNGGEYGANFHPSVQAHQRMSTNLIAAISGLTGW